MDRRLKWAAAALACGLAAGAAAIPWRISAETPVRRMAELAQSALGAQAQMRPAMRLRLLPAPQIEFADLRVSGPDGAFDLEAPRAQARLRLTALLAGRIEFASLRLVGPSASVEADALADMTALLRALGQLAQGAPSAPDSITIMGGEMLLRGRDGASRAFRDVRLALEWRGDVSAAGSFLHGGERFTVEGLLTHPALALRGEDSPFTLKIASDVLNLSLNGVVAGGARWLVEGRLASASERLRSLLALLDARPAAPTRLNRFALSGQFRALPQTLSLADLKLALDQNAFEGSLTLRSGEARPRLSGTLAARALEMKGADLGLGGLVASDKGWSRERIAFPAFDAFDADLRISASRAHFGRFVLSDAGLLVKVEGGAFEAVLADSQAYGGKLRGRLTMRGGEALDMRLAATFSGLESGALLRDLSGKARIAGPANGDVSLSASGANAAALMESLSGQARASVGRGEIMGLDIEQAVRRAERRPLSIAADMRAGQTKFTNAEFEASATRGAISLTRAEITGLGMEMTIAGEASAPERSLRLAIAAAPPRSGGGQKREPVIFLDLEGPWDEPSLSLDADKLIRRSSAAAPLLPPKAPGKTPPDAAREVEAAPAAAAD
jgi:AsmA protein